MRCKKVRITRWKGRDGGGGTNTHTPPKKSLIERVTAAREWTHTKEKDNQSRKILCLRAHWRVNDGDTMS